jgi:hypothetical protein
MLVLKAEIERDVPRFLESPQHNLKTVSSSRLKKLHHGTKQRRTSHKERQNCRQLCVFVEPVTVLMGGCVKQATVHFI